MRDVKTSTFVSARPPIPHTVVQTRTCTHNAPMAMHARRGRQLLTRLAWAAVIVAAAAAAEHDEGTCAAGDDSCEAAGRTSSK